MNNNIELHYKFIEFDKDHADIQNIYKLIKDNCDELCSRVKYLNDRGISSGVSKSHIIKIFDNLIKEKKYKGYLLTGDIEKYGKLRTRPIAFIIFHNSYSRNFNSFTIDVFCRASKSIKGSGRFLFDKLIKLAKDNKIQVIFLESLYGSLDYYTKIGFVEFEKDFITDSPENVNTISLGLFVDDEQTGGGVLNNKLFPIYYINKKCNLEVNNKILCYLKTKFNIDSEDSIDAMDFYKSSDFVLYTTNKEGNIIGCIAINKDFQIMAGVYYFICSNFYYDSDIIADILLEKLREYAFQMKIPRIHFSLFRNQDACKFIETKNFKERHGSDIYAYYAGK